MATSKFAYAIAAFIFSIVLSFGTFVTADEHGAVGHNIRLPDGFSIALFARVPSARSIALGGPGGEIYVGTRYGSVFSLLDADGDGRAEQVIERAQDLNVPNGLAVVDGHLYVALQDRLARWQLGARPLVPRHLREPQTVYSAFYDHPHHGWRYLRQGPDGGLYVSLGAPCNICRLRPDTGKIVRIEPGGSSASIIADGVRNSVGFDWQPITGKLHFTDNGADRMGDDIPPDELNRVDVQGSHFGFPWRGGRAIRLTGYENHTPTVATVSPVVEFQAHTASLGIEFYDGDMFPKTYRGDAFVAQHGSWNRTVPVGYRIMRVQFGDDGEPTGREVFADGWLAEDGAVLGRPVDIVTQPDGSLLVSDDYADAIYRISYAQ